MGARGQIDKAGQEKRLRAGAPEPFVVPPRAGGLFALGADRVGGLAVNRVVAHFQRRLIHP
ncbi:hypothetical protein SAMN05444159_4624 [Bradyrhizobium lablabi]|uniref:Uncharacterized protein n=1 Tax=Bradyrhizobium lablabi TaxID=722472 RepID=A0A1M6WPS2_9BRAD|nr:hypothetical protein SAMN05444159_4624 [Bradyrhizobium lablabi]